MERNHPLQAHNSFGIAAKALQLVRIHSEDDIRAVLAEAELSRAPKFVLGGGQQHCADR